VGAEAAGGEQIGGPAAGAHLAGETVAREILPGASRPKSFSQTSGGAAK